MARSSTSFKKGQSGNPGGKKPGYTFRRALREELERPSKKYPGANVYQEWARELVAQAIGQDDKVELIKLLEGAAPLIKPSDEPLDDPESHDADGNTVEP